MSEDTHQFSQTRRKWLTLMGMGSAGLLAGCSGDSGGDTNTTNGGGGDSDTPEESSQTLTFATQTNTDEQQYNFYNNSQHEIDTSRLLFGWLARRAETEAEWVPHLAEDWEISGTTATINLSDEYTWHNGDPVTAADVETKIRLDYVMGRAISDMISSAEAVDDTTVSIELDGEINSDIFFQTLFSSTTLIDTPESVYGEFISDVGYDQSDYSAVQEEVVGFSYEDPIGWGPFEFDRRTNQEIILTKYDDHPQADQINFSTIELVFMDDSQQKVQAFLTDNLDAAESIPSEQQYEQLQQSNIAEYPFPGYMSAGLHFNQNDVEELQDARVRKALCHAMDKSAMAGNINLIGYGALNHDSGYIVSEDLHEPYFGDGFVDQLTVYDDEDQAVSLLEDAGFTREDGQWYTPDGDRFQLTLKAASEFGSFRQGTMEATEQLKDFGIAAEVEMVNIQNYMGQTLPQGDFDIAASFVGEQRPHPVSSLRAAFYGYYGFSPNFNSTEEFSVPMPIGDPSGSTETVNVRDLIDRISSQEENQEDLRLLSWVYNQTMPSYVMAASDSYEWLNTESWSAPTDTLTADVQYPLSFMLHNGELQAKA